jgi:hypothetical protein
MQYIGSREFVVNSSGSRTNAWPSLVCHSPEIESKHADGHQERPTEYAYEIGLNRCGGCVVEALSYIHGSAGPPLVDSFPRTATGRVQKLVIKATMVEELGLRKGQS